MYIVNTVVEINLGFLALLSVSLIDINEVDST